MKNSNPKRPILHWSSPCGFTDKSVTVVWDYIIEKYGERTKFKPKAVYKLK